MRDAPLREAFFLLIGLCLLAVPLYLIIEKEETVERAVVEIESEGGEWVMDVEVASAHAFDWMELRRGEEVLGRIEGLTTEGEFECLLARHGGMVTLAASYPEGTPETAMRLQLWAGSLPEVAFTVWGEGGLLEELEVKFHE